MFTLDKLKEAFQKTTSNQHVSTSNQFQMHLIPESATLRFLPDPNSENDWAFLQEEISHTGKIDGKGTKIPCIFDYDEKIVCPMCELSKKLYAAGNKDAGKQAFKNKRWHAQVLVIDDGHDADSTQNGNVLPILLTKSMIEKIFEAADDLTDDFFSFKDGTHCKIIRKKNAYGQNEYSFKFVRKSTDLELDKDQKESMVKLNSLLLEETTIEELAKMAEEMEANF